ncbi:MAG TPA: adenylate/guanylate cyclase domain-containing protein [Solirubrobacteraceae bacterium]|nr:adenylate/guanylate cyclase domain-containing protein [Solirubrobacteraceae bacterium]
MAAAHWRKRRTLELVAVALFAVALAIAAYATNLLRSSEQQTLDARYSIRGRQPTPRDLVIVGVNHETLETIRRQWPYPRHYTARVIENLVRAGAKSIAVDLQFTQRTNRAEDIALAEAVESAHGKIALATAEIGPHGETNILGGNEFLKEIGARPASAVLLLDSDGVVRNFPWGTNDLQSLGVVAYELTSHRHVSRSTFDHGALPVDFVGPPESIPEISYSKVDKGEYAANEFRGKTVLLGATAPILQDVHDTATSGSRVMSGPEIWANVENTLALGVPLKRAPAWLDILLICLMGAVVPLACLRLRGVASTLLAIPLAALYAVGVQVAFNSGLIVSFVYAMLALLLATLGTLLVLYQSEAAERERVRDLFGRFVAPDVIEQVVERAGDNLRLTAVERDCTVLFSDLRGFTSFSETQPAARVIDVINTYLSEMTDAIQDHGGTMICYMGDGIMAVFGAPLDQPDHADRAVQAALEMIGPRLEHFNDWMNANGHDHRFAMGVGLNSGTVMAGNIGAENRVEYTALGDTTNTAARLEGMTKGSGHMLFFADSTRARLHHEYPGMQEVGELEVRGRVQKVPVWTIEAEAAPEAGDAQAASSPTAG